MTLYLYNLLDNRNNRYLEDVVNNDMTIFSRSFGILNNMLEKKFINKFIGKNMNVLYELKSTSSVDDFEGYTNNYIKVASKSKRNIECEFHMTKLIENRDDHLLGEV